MPSQPEGSQSRLEQQQVQSGASTAQQFVEYGQQTTDLYSTLSQPFTFNFAPLTVSGQSISGNHPFQGASHTTKHTSYEKTHAQKQALPRPAGSSPSGASESAFAQSFYKAEGPGLNHFQTVLSREFNVPEGGSPTTGSLSVQANDPSSIRSEIGFSPAGSDVSLPAHMERDLVALADLTTTQQTLFGLYWCFVHVQWPIGGFCGLYVQIHSLR